MCNIIISDREWDLLSREPADYLKLYVVVKRRMDFATGIAGEKTLINETVLREGFTVDPLQGRAKPRPVTRQRYRSALARLEKIGLLERRGKLVFFFPQAPLCEGGVHLSWGKNRKKGVKMVKNQVVMGMCDKYLE